MEIDISITLITYNQEKYVGQAIDSVLQQNINCGYEIVIVDDCSTDATYKICEQYYEAHKDVIRLYKNEVNVGATKNQLIACKKCRGKYICHLEGDDYWVDNLKLQKQYDFLNRHSEYIGVAHRNRVIDSSGKEIFIAPKRFKRVVRMKDFLKKYLFSGTSTMYRNYFSNVDEKYEEMATCVRNVGDLNYCLYLLHLGPIYQLSDIMMNYRAYQSNNFNNIISKADSTLMHLKICNVLENYYENRYSLDNFRFEHLSICYLSRFFGDKENKKHSKEAFKKAKQLVTKSVVMMTFLRLPFFVCKHIPLFISKRRKLR